MMIRFRSIALYTLILLLAASGCQNDGSTSSELEVRDFRYVQLPSGERQVMGTLENSANRAVSSAQVQVSLFNENNERIDKMHITVKDIPASDSVEFKETVNSDFDIAGARVQGIIVM